MNIFQFNNLFNCIYPEINQIPVFNLIFLKMESANFYY